MGYLSKCFPSTETDEEMKNQTRVCDLGTLVLGPLSYLNRLLSVKMGSVEWRLHYQQCLALCGGGALG